MAKDRRATPHFFVSPPDAPDDRNDLVRRLHQEAIEDAGFYDRVARQIGRTVVGRTNDVTRGVEAIGLIDAAMAWIHNKAARLSETMSPFEWLLFLRCVPNGFFAGNHTLYPGSIEERRFASEILSMSRPRQIETGDGDERTAELLSTTLLPQSIHRITVYGRQIAHLRVCMRVAAKGCPITISEIGSLRVEDSPEFQVVQHWDARQEASNRHLPLLQDTGLRPEERITNPGNYLAFDLNEDRDLPPFYTIGSTTWAEPQLLAGYPWYRPELPALVFAGKILSYTAATVTKDRLLMMQRRGFETFDPGYLLDLVGGALEREIGQGVGAAFPEFATDYPDARSILDFALAPPTVRPFAAGPLLRQAPEGVLCVDYAAITNRMRRWPDYLSHDTPARNVKATYFERRVQAHIDTTTWRPPEGIQRFIGVPIKADDGHTITDLDALAVRDGVCLVLNCKTHEIPGLLEGEYGPQLNVLQRIEEALEDWRKKVAYLEDHPTGRNYNLTGLTLVPGLVLETLPWLGPVLLDKVSLDGLYVVATLPELVAWLSDVRQ